MPHDTFIVVCPNPFTVWFVCVCVYCWAVKADAPENLGATCDAKTRCHVGVGLDVQRLVRGSVHRLIAVTERAVSFEKGDR